MSGLPVMFAVASKCAVLIVEDHSDTSEMLRRHLIRKKLQQQQIQTVPDAASALEFIENTIPSCMIVDQTIPGMSGIELVREIHSRDEFQDITIFFYSAAYDWRQQMEAEALGAKRWFVKGVSRLDDLIDSVVAVCGITPE